VVINEFLANSSVVDWIELYNAGPVPVDLNGYYLTDNPAMPTKAQINATWSPGTTTIAPGGFWVSTETDWATFKLGSGGEQVYLIAPDGVTWVDGRDFGNQPVEDLTEGRFPDGDESWRKMVGTPGAANIDPTQTAIVIHEIMYHPLGDTETDPGPEYIELYNTSGSPVSLTGWRFSQGVDYEFPVGMVIPAGGYLVIAANPALVASTYGIGGVLGPYDGVLSNFSDEMELEDFFGNRADYVEYRQEGFWPEACDGAGPSLELANYSMDNRLPGAWRASSGTGTPGAANSQSVVNPPASVDRVRHTPVVPASTDTVTVTARAGAGNLTSVTLQYKRDQDGGFSSAAMLDDGLHGDEQASDGIWGGTIPAQTSGTIVEFYVQANATGGNETYPAGAAANNSCLYIVQNTPPASNLPVFRFVLTDENWNALLVDPYSDTPRDCTFIHGDKAYYNASVRFRGGTRGGPKYSYKVYLTPGYRFRGADRFDLNYEKNDGTLLKRKTIYNLVNRMGLPGSMTEYIHTRWRNGYAGVHLYIEDHGGGDYLDNHFPGDADGNLYKGIAPWNTQVSGVNIAWGGSCSWFELQSDGANCGDLALLHQTTSPTVPDATYETQVRGLIDVVNWGRSFAVLATGCLIDTPWHFHNQNYRLYRRPSDQRFVHVLHDFDDGYWSTMYASAGPSATVFADTDRFLQRAPFQREQYHGLWRALNLTDGVYRDDRVLTEVAYHHDVIYDDVDADPISGSGAKWTTFQNGLAQWNTWVTTRNSLLRGFLNTVPLEITTNGGSPIVTGSANLTLQGTAPLSAPRLEIAGTETNITWNSTTQWERGLVLTAYYNTIVVRTLDDGGTEIERVSIDVTYTNGLPPGAAFTADVTSGAPPLTVQFTDQSSLAGITAWDWDFGDGATSTDQHPSHPYTAEGAFTVRLTVTHAQGQDTEEKVNYISVASRPQIAFVGGQLPATPSDSAVVAHLESLGMDVDVYDDEPANRPPASQIAATHDVVVGSSTILSANVAGEFRNEPTPFIYWESSLSLNGRESIADGAGTFAGSTQINVVNNAHPVMNGVSLGTVTVLNAANDISMCSGAIAPGAQVLATQVGNVNNRTVIVAEPGALLLDGGTAAGKRAFLYLYDTTWLNTNAIGKKILDNAIGWGLGPVMAAFSADVTTGPAPLAVTFTDESTGPANSWAWDFGDTNGSALRHPTHVYTLPGTYTVTLTVDSGVTDPDALVKAAYIMVVSGVPADFDGDGDVDLDDYALFAGCATGPDLGPPAPGCGDKDLDDDNDVDQSDFGTMQRCFSGDGVPADSTCAD
jgi:PKD repeat protein